MPRHTCWMLVGPWLLAFAGCADSSGDSADTCDTDAVSCDTSDDVHDEDIDWDDSDVTSIVLEGTSITVDGPGVDVAGATVTITSAGTYDVSGTLDDGQIVVDTADENLVRLLLDGADVSCSTGSPLEVGAADDVLVFLVKGTSNRLADGSSYVFASGEDEPNAALFSKADLTIGGPGTLTIEGNFNDGIASKDSLVLTNGVIVVTAVDDGVRGKDSVEVRGGCLVIDAGGDGLKADNEKDADLGFITVEDGTLLITAGGDALAAQTWVTISGGTLALHAGGGSDARLGEDESAKGVKGTMGMTIDGGAVTIDAADDAVHSDGDIVIGGGSLCIATGDDAVHADGSLAIEGGEITVIQSVEGLESPLITIDDGVLYVTSSDDGINATTGSGGERDDGSSVTLNGGYVVLHPGADGYDSNGTARITGGTLIVHGPSREPEVPVDVNGSFPVTGGLMVAAGAGGNMLEGSDSSSTQKVLIASLQSSRSAGTLVDIRRSDGTDILTFQPDEVYRALVYSSSSLTNGSYTLYSGGSYSGGSCTDGLCSGGAYDPSGASSTAFTVSGTVTTVGTGGGPP